MDYKEFEKEYFRSDNWRSTHSFIAGCVERSNSLMGKNDYYIHLLFMYCDTEESKKKARSGYKDYITQINELKTTYLVGLGPGNGSDKPIAFIQDGTEIVYDRDLIDSVIGQFNGLRPGNNKKIQSVIFKVKDGKPITDDAIECQLSYSKVYKIKEIETAMNGEYLKDDYCINTCQICNLQFIRPLISVYGPNAKNKTGFRGIPGKDHFYIHQYRRGLAILTLFLISLISTLYLGYNTIVNNYRPVIWLMLLIPTTISIWFYSMHDSDKLYNKISLSEKSQDFEFIPSRTNGLRFDPTIFLDMYAGILTFGALAIYAKLGFVLWEFLVCLIIGITCFAVSFIYKRTHPED